MSERTEIDRQTAVTCTFLDLAALLAALPEERWDTPSLCAGWRVREVVAHMTMPVRYSPAEFMAELQACGGDFTRLSNLIAERDAALPVSTLVANLRDERLHRWTPPGGGIAGALNHVVIHSLDITVPLGVTRCASDEGMRLVLDDLTRGGVHVHFGFDLDGLELRATDLDWSYGEGRLISGRAEDLALLICGRVLPAGRIEGAMAGR
jgi:uncharacterized protein (TIGR03083 family)